MAGLSDYTTEQLEAEIESRKKLAIAQDSAVRTTSVQEYIDSQPALVDLGITAIADNADPSWIRLKIPFASETGYKKALMIGFAGELISSYGGKTTDDPTEIRVRHDRAIGHLKKIVSISG